MAEATLPRCPSASVGSPRRSERYTQRDLDAMAPLAAASADSVHRTGRASASGIVWDSSSRS
jgi:hypothetical protein